MSDDLKVDWSRPIEAYHEDGRVVTCTFLGDDGEDFLPMRVAGVPEDGAMATYQEGYFERDGTRIQSYWRIRNVAEVPCNSKDPQDDLTKRMEALVRAMADETSMASWMDHRSKARAIVALLPEPVDADLVEARECVAAVYEAASRHDLAKITRDGGQDKRLRVQSALAAIRRGRALERDSREG